MKKVVVIGGGPAGMMAAVSAATAGATVILLEKNDQLGKKLLLTGKGRCNLTNACELEEFLKRFGRNGPFLRDAFKDFFNKELMVFFEKRGVRLKVERQQRVFPESDKAISIVNALKKTLKDCRVQIRLNTAVEGLLIKEAGIIGVRVSEGEKIPADAVILATGGCSYPKTGSTGDGLRFIRHAGHSVTPLLPALSALETVEKYPRKLEGLALRNITLTFNYKKKKIKTDVGELLFTSKGISGPLVISHSGQIAQWLSEAGKVTVDIDLKPGLSEKEMESRLLRELEQSPKRSLRILFKKLLPLSLIDVFLEIANVDHRKQANQITNHERIRLLTLLKSFPMTIARPCPIEAAMVTRGGISVKEINPRTMQSRVINGLFFSGEIIDIDADTGGFNLQAAFSSGHLAGRSSVLI